MIITIYCGVNEIGGNIQVVPQGGKGEKLKFNIVKYFILEIEIYDY